ncbi:MAG: cation diffusion facilitator family transporter [Thermoplasmata archaeon]
MNKRNLMIILSFFFVFISFVIRIIGSLLTGNIALIIESLHIFMDVFITLTILIVIKIIYSKQSMKFPYGLFKLEDMVSFILAIIIIYFSFELIFNNNYHNISGMTVSSIFELISVIPLVFSSIYKIKASRLFNSPSLKNDGIHTFADIVEGLFVSIGLYLTNYFGVISYYFSIMIAFIALIVTSYLIGKNAILSLLDLPHDPNLKIKMMGLLKNVKEIKNVKDIRFRWAGPSVFVEIVVEMDPRLTIDEAHPITENIENMLKNNIEGIYSVTVHVEPVKRNDFKVLIPLLNENINSEIDSQLGRANYYAIFEIKGESIKYDIRKNNLINKENLVGVDFIKFLLDENVTDVICKNVGDIIYGLLISRDIYCWYFDGKNAEEAIKMLMENKLKKLKIQ